jgi:hypothetical protein
MARRSIRDLFSKKRRGKPALDPEMRSLILSFDAHLQKRNAKGEEPQDVGSAPNAVDDASAQASSGGER